MSVDTLKSMKSQPEELDPGRLREVEATCACFNLRKASRAVTQIFDEVLEPSGLQITQFTLLLAVAAVGTATMVPLAQGLVMDRTTLTRNLKPLERLGLVEVKPGRDRRTRVVTLTPAGQTALAKALPLWEQAQAIVQERLGNHLYSLLLSALSDTIALVREP
jgi:DNA-binding MarR family transcriptional regulator